MLSVRENAPPASQVCESRLRFGFVAEQYDRVRPGYPAELIDTVFAYARLVPGDRALDVGTGTGQAAMAFATRGLEVLAVDPSPAMAEIANRKFAAAGLDARAIVSDFETATLEEGGFSLISAATSWHWLDPDTRFQAAAQAIADGGTLAVFWTWPHWRRTALRGELDQVYKRSGAPLAEMGPMCPVEPDPRALALEWVRHTQESGIFGEPHAQLFSWAVTYTATGYSDLLGTYGDHIALTPEIRGALFDGIEQTIDDAGGAVKLQYTTLLLLARAG